MIKSSCLRVLLGVITLGSFSLPLAAQTTSIDQLPSITVSGTGTVSRTPDIAFVRVGVETEASAASQALQDNNRAMRELMDVLRKQNIPDKHIQTEQFDVSPQYRSNPGRPGQATEEPRITGYRVTNQVRVKVTEIDRLGELLDQVVQVGANRIRGIQFDIDEPTGAMNEARKLAVTEARRVAELLATAAGASLGNPLRIDEGGQGPSPMPRNMRMMAMAESVPVAQGEQQVTAQVTITYELVRD